MSLRPLFITSMLLTLGACGDEGGDTGDGHTHTHPSSSKELSLMFHGMLGMVDATCGVDATAGTGSSSVQLADARMFVSNLQLRNEGGEWVALELEQDTPWQHENVALLDWENGSGACADSGTSDVNYMVNGTLPAGTYDGLRFDVGVPFELNHVDNTTAPAPLNAPGMYWTWQGGYKFVRVDFAVDGAERFNVHIGSTGCDSAAPTEAPTEPCSKPNLSTVELDYTEGDMVMVDLLQLVAGSDLTVNTADSPPGCMSNPAEPDDCTPVFESLGLDFSTGGCVGECADQGVFFAGTM